MKILNLSGSKLTDKTLGDLFHRASAAFQSLEDLDLSCNRIGVESIKSTTTALIKSPSSGLWCLDLSHNSPEVSELQALEDAVRGGSLPNLRELNLRGSLTSDADINGSLLEALSFHCPLLGELSLSQNNLGVPEISALARIISQHRNVVSHSPRDGTPNLISAGFRPQQFNLNLDTTKLSDKGLSTFIESLESPCHFRELHLKGNGIHATGVSCLTGSTCLGKIVMQGALSLLCLDDNPLGLEGTVAIGRMLSSSHCQLRQVTLSRCQLTTAGGGLPNTNCPNLDYNVTSEVVRDVGQQLCQMPQNNTIKWLYLDGNSFTGEGIYVLAGFMYLCPCLDKLSSSHCRITSDDLEQILDKLAQIKVSSPSVCYKLMCWNLSNNEIDDSGVSVLLDHLPLLFPNLDYTPIIGVFLYDNPVSSEMMRRMNEEMERRSKVRCYE